MGDEALCYWKGSMRPTLCEALVKMSMVHPVNPALHLGEWCKLACLGVVKENDRLKSELLVLCEVIANLQPSGLCNLSIPAGYVTVLPCRNHFQCL